jgi:hypothetical protein
MQKQFYCQQHYMKLLLSLKRQKTLQLYKAQFDEAIALFQQEMSRNYTAEYNAGI